MKNADAAAIRKSLGCMKRCQAAGERTHHRDCPAVGKWLDEVPAASRSRTASVPVHELEELVTRWRISRLGEAWTGAMRSCADDVQALIDKATP